MKPYMLFVCGAIFLLLSLNTKMLFADEEKAYTEVVDIVYEWSPDGSSIQVGGYLISSFGSVWIERGDGKSVQTNSNKIKNKDLVKAYLIERDENGFWTADRIIVLSDKAFSAAVESLPESKKNEIMLEQENVSEKPTTLPKLNGPVLKDGVWIN